MGDERLRALVAQLDFLVPRAGAAIVEDCGLYDSEFDPAFTGNRLGYLRLGIELLKLADAPPAPGHPDRVVVDLTYLGFAGPQPEAFERREDVTAPRLESVGGGGPSFKMIPLGIIGVVITWALVTAISQGLGEILRWVAARF